MLMKTSQSMYIYTDYNNVDSFIPIKISSGEEIKFKTMLSGDRKVEVAVKHLDDNKLGLFKKTNDKVVVDGYVFKDEMTSKKRGISAYSGEFI